MRRSAFLSLALCAAAVAAASALAASPTIAAKTPVATLAAENTAFNASNWKALWSAYTPTYKSHCSPYSTFAKNFENLRKQLHGKLTTKVTGVRIAGSKAYLAYQLLVGGKVVQTTKASNPDVYLKVNGIWYDEYEPTHGC